MTRSAFVLQPTTDDWQLFVSPLWRPGRALGRHGETPGVKTPA
jgi:hypothetical protein